MKIDSRSYTCAIGACAAFGLAVGAASAQDCGAGTVSEMEFCGEDTNGGCNAQPAAFQDIDCGDSVNGTAWADMESRDTDWYRVALPDPDGDGQATLRATLSSEFPGVVFIIAGIDDCNSTIVASGFSDPGCAGGDAVAACLPPGNYTVFVSVGNPDGSAIFEGYPCIAGENDYLVTVECIQAGEPNSECIVLDPACIDAAGGCDQANGTPGCDDPVCCTEVCNFDPFCCNTEWDETCVEAAVAICGIFVYECNSGAGAPANDCCTDPMMVMAGDTVMFDTTMAATDGPEAECGSTGGDTQVHNDVWYIIQAPGDGRLTASVCGAADFDTKIAAYNAGDGSLECSQLIGAFIGCNEDCTAEDTASELSLDVAANTFYLIRLGGFNTESGTGVISFDFKQVLWDTGPNRALVFNGALTNLGWSSGSPAAGQPQRWTAQAFTLPALPEGAGTWNICQLNPNGFEPAGVLNETLEYIVWARTGTDQPVDGDQIVSGSVPLPFAVEDPDGDAGNLWRYPMSVDFDLPPGDYWLTVYGANTTGGASNWAWFANPDNGINVLDGGGAPFMWRSEMFPDPGFQMYTTPLVEQAEGLDPNDVYNASFEVLGNPVEGAPCPADLDGSGDVGPADLAILLAAWDSDPGGPPDFDGNGSVGPEDLAVLLAAWGDCP